MDSKNPSRNPAGQALYPPCKGELPNLGSKHILATLKSYSIDSICGAIDAIPPYKGARGID